MHYDLGFFDQEAIRVECAQNPFEAQVLPMSPAEHIGNTFRHLGGPPMSWALSAE